MLKINENHEYDAYCDWCGKFCGPAGVRTWSHQFCSERCKRAYDNANGTVDGGYQKGSVGHSIHNTAKSVKNFIEKLLGGIFVGLIIVTIIMSLFK